MRNAIAGLALVLGVICNALPAVADPYADRGEALYKAGDYRNAGRYFAQSLQANPANPRALYMSAMCLQGLGNTDAAKNGLQTVVQVFPSSTEAQLAKAALSGHPQPIPPAPVSSAATRAATTRNLAPLKNAPHATTSSTSKTTVTRTVTTNNKKVTTESSTQSATGEPSTTSVTSTSSTESGETTKKTPEAK